MPEKSNYPTSSAGAAGAAHRASGGDDCPCGRVDMLCIVSLDSATLTLVELYRGEDREGRSAAE